MFVAPRLNCTTGTSRQLIPLSLVLLISLSSCTDAPLDPDAVASEVKFVTVSAGLLEIPSSNPEKEPRRLTLSHDLEVSSCEITQREFLALMEVNPSYHSGGIYPDWEKRPVEHVTWYDAVLFCNELSKRRGLEPVYGYTYVSGELISGVDDLAGIETNFDASGYRLPTLTEWEYLCRAGTVTDFYRGDLEGEGLSCTISEPVAEEAGWFCTNTIDRVHPVGQSKPTGLKVPNAFGLYDMHGNVWEWCQESNTVRGGSWINPPADARSAGPTPHAWASGCYGSSRYYNVGFRVVRKAS